MSERTDANAADRIEEYLTASGLSAHHPRVEPMTGDASDRRYFRVRMEGRHPIVLALHTGPIHFATMPFAIVGELLGRMGIPAPAVLGHADALGIIALDDLGDVTLQVYLAGADARAARELYRGAVSLIHQLQTRGHAFASPDSVPYTLAFDVEKLTFELNFFVQHFLEGHRAVALAAADRVALDDEFSAIVQELAGEPRVVCHRDYHSRNLMVHNGRLYMIDFQDARMGPDTYDLVSLLRDSYVDISAADVDALIAHFLQLGGHADPAEFRRRFDLMAVQRNLKALGTFGFQASARGNAGYLQYVPRTLRSVRENLLKYPRFARLQELLGACVPELR
jgi:aminoglycoside/choline kinase family phosphotransferase